MQAFTILRRVRLLTVSAVFVGLASTASAIPEPQFQSAFKVFLQAGSGDNSYRSSCISDTTTCSSIYPFVLGY